MSRIRGNKGIFGYRGMKYMSTILFGKEVDDGIGIGWGKVESMGGRCIDRGQWKQSREWIACYLDQCC